MNGLVRCVALGALLALAGCGGQPSSESTPAAPAGGSAPAAGGSAVAAVSKYDAGPRAADSPADHEAAERGEKLFKEKGCSACHAFGTRMSGPDLAGVSRRRTAEWMENQILHPDVMVKEDPIARQLFATHAMQMPNQGLTPGQAKDVVEYLKSQDAKAASSEKEESK